MSEYDAELRLRAARPAPGASAAWTDRCTALQIKLKNYEADKVFVTAELRKLFPYAGRARRDAGRSSRGRCWPRSTSNAAS